MELFHRATPKVGSGRNHCSKRGRKMSGRRNDVDDGVVGAALRFAASISTNGGLQGQELSQWDVSLAEHMEAMRRHQRKRLISSVYNNIYPWRPPHSGGKFELGKRQKLYWDRPQLYCDLP